jgi:hypothetical protein
VAINGNSFSRFSEDSKKTASTFIMPASAGRVRMPHNNRMTTSATLKTSDIWSKTIGHDPYANQADQQEPTLSSRQDADASTAAKVKTVMAMARNQNVTDGSNREGFTAKLYLGLKTGKVRRSGVVDETGLGAVDPKLQQLLEDPDSSSEEEFVEVVSENHVKHNKEDRRKKKKRRKTKKRKKRSRNSSDDDDDHSSSSSSNDSDDDDASDERRRRRREKRKRSNKKKDSKRSHGDSDGDSEEAEKKRRKLKRHRKES